jgi:hypothetical protein
MSIALRRWRGSIEDEPYVHGGRGVVGAAAKPLKATPNIITPGDLDSYIALLDPLIESLEKDKQQIVFEDPAVLEAEADLLTAPVVAPVRASLLERAKKLRELMKTKNGEQIEAEQKWGNDWHAFYAQWQADKKALGGAIFLTSGGDWSRLQGDDLNYQKLRARFESIGGTPSRSIPETEPDTPAVTSVVPWWAWALGGTAAAAAVVVVATR